MPSFLLVHAPLLGPGSWRPCADLLTRAGYRAVVPDLHDATEAADGWWDRAADACVAAASDLADVVVVAHSGAGVLVPLVALHCRAVSAVFVDAITPAASGETASSDHVRRFVASVPREAGRLRRWSTWWGDDQLAELMPDAVLRAALLADQTRLPADFYDYPVPVPVGWEPSTIAYLQLSEAYDGDAREARRRGWAVHHLAGSHLDPLTRPEAIACGVLTSLGL